MASLLSDPEVIMNEGDNAMRREAQLNNNPFREELDIDTYARYLDIYRQVMNSYVEFFVSNWYKDDVQRTNDSMIKALEEVGIKGWSGLTEEENNPLGWYVITLDFPVTSSQMKEFFKRVMTGGLEFRCRYPMGDTTAKDLIKNNVDQKFYIG